MSIATLSISYLSLSILIYTTYFSQEMSTTDVRIFLFVFYKKCDLSLQRKEGVAHGPETIRAAGLIQELKILGIDL